MPQVSDDEVDHRASFLARIGLRGDSGLFSNGQHVCVFEQHAHAALIGLLRDTHRVRWTDSDTRTTRTGRMLRRTNGIFRRSLLLSRRLLARGPADSFPSSSASPQPSTCALHCMDGQASLVAIPGKSSLLSVSFEDCSLCPR